MSLWWDKLIQRQAIQAIREFFVSCPDTLIAIMQNGGGTWYEMALGIIESLADSPEPGANDLFNQLISQVSDSGVQKALNTWTYVELSECKYYINTSTGSECFKEKIIEKESEILELFQWESDLKKESEKLGMNLNEIRCYFTYQLYYLKRVIWVNSGGITGFIETIKQLEK